MTDAIARPRIVARLLPSLLVLLGCASGSLHAQPAEFETKKDSLSEPRKVLKEVPPADFRPVFPCYLAQVPELEFQAAPAPGVSARESADRIARMVADINALDGTKPDGFIEALRGERPDFVGLPFLLGDACRSPAERNKPFRQTVQQVRRSGLDPNEARLSGGPQDQGIPARIDALMQMLATEPYYLRLRLINYLAKLPQPEATRALARLAVYDPEAGVRQAAVRALKGRQARDYDAVLVGGLRYPWHEVPENAVDAIVLLERSDLIPLLVDLLDEPDPRAPVLKAGTKDTFVVREVVRVNHHRSCLLCHAPGNQVAEDSDVLTASMPIPGEPLPLTPGKYYERQPSRRILVRVDVTYLRQDFSALLPVENAGAWPSLQRYDFLVRTRTLTAQEAEVYRQALSEAFPDPQSRSRLAVPRALRRLTGRDAGLTSAAWRQMLDLPAREAPTNEP